MVLDPITTFFVYMTAIAVVFTLIAAIADLWLAMTERRLRNQARAQARAKRREERELSRVEWL